MRAKGMNEGERTAIEMKTLMGRLHLAGTYDQVNSPSLVGLETISRRVAQIVEAYSSDSGKPKWDRCQTF